MENEQLAKRELGGQSFIERLIEKTDSLEEVKKVGMVIIESGFCPEHFKTSKDAVGAIMCIEAGRKLGLSWMQSLSDIYPVKGRIGIMGTAAKAVIFASGVLESWKEFTEGEYPNANYKHVTISKRKDLPDIFRTEFSVFDASTAGLMQKDIYKKYGKRMIAWRDIGFHASDYYQDILKGMKTVEELNDYDGLVPGTPEKITLKTEDGKELTFTGMDKEHSKKSTSRVASKIPDGKFANQNITDVTPVTQTVMQPIVINESNPPEKKEETPFVPSKDSSEFMNGVKIIRDDAGKITNQAEVDAGASTDDKLSLKEMEEMDSKDLMKIINDDMELMEACQTIPGKNTNKKLRDIIFAHQNGNLLTYVASVLPKPEQTVTESVDTTKGEIPINKDFDNQKGTPIFQNQDILTADKPKEATGTNKYGLEIPPYDKGEERDFSVTKALYNALAGLTPSLNNQRYLELASKKGILAAFADKEHFCKYATTTLINELIDTN
jgi:hypothetical protein